MRDDGTTRTATRATVAGGANPTLIRWGAIFGGAVLGLALMTLLASLWLALAYASNLDTIRTNLEWYMGGTAAGSLFIAGILTGYLSGIRHAITGMLNGWALWGLLLLVTVSIGVPSILNLFDLGRVATGAASGVASLGADTTLWAVFWTIAGGFVAAGIGGAIGGALSRERGVRAEVRSSADTEPVVVHDDDDHDDHADHARHEEHEVAGSRS